MQVYIHVHTMYMYEDVHNAHLCILHTHILYLSVKKFVLCIAKYGI